MIPLILRHIEILPSQILVLSPDDPNVSFLKDYPVSYKKIEVLKENYTQVLSAELQPGDFLLNLSVNVSSVDLIKLCQKLSVLYLDTCIEPWSGGYTDTSKSPSLRSNYALRESVLELKRNYSNDSSTAVVAHGANPGLVSHFVKQGLLNIAQDNGLKIETPKSKSEWASLAENLGIKVIHIAEYDSQRSTYVKSHNEFVNTWSVDGFVSEGLQPSELGWGTHEKHMPKDGKKHSFGCNAAIYLNRPGMTTKVKTWTPTGGSIHGFLITHNEAISIADYFSIKDQYRPTVHYSYRPCSEAIISIHDFLSTGNLAPNKTHVLNSEIVEGIDELGVLLMGNKKGVYWFGSQLSIKEARKLCPYNSATSLQVAIGVFAAMIWIIKNPNAGILEAEDLDFDQIISISKPYLGNLIGVYSDWNPTKTSLTLFGEKLDEDVWQFENFRV